MTKQIKEKKIFLVSCVGTYEDSGFGTGAFLLNNNGKNIVVDYIDCTGLYKYEGSYYRFIRSLKLLIGYNELGIFYSCKFPNVEDCHDILVENNKVTFVSTSNNTIVTYDFTGKLIKEHQLQGEGDAWHLNCLETVGDDIYVAAFGEFEKHREWNLNGCLEKGFIFRLADNIKILNGLSGPHQPRFIDGKWFICDSHKKALRVYNSKEDYEEIYLGGFTRGFCYDENNIYIGISADRKSKNPSESHIICLDRKSLSIIEKIKIPFPEIYDIVICSENMASSIVEDINSFRLNLNINIIDKLKNLVKRNINLNIRVNRKINLMSKKNPFTRLIKKIKNKLF